MTTPASTSGESAKALAAQDAEDVRWEYRVVGILNQEERLNQLGSEGWEAFGKYGQSVLVRRLIDGSGGAIRETGASE